MSTAIEGHNIEATAETRPVTIQPLLQTNNSDENNKLSVENIHKFHKENNNHKNENQIKVSTGVQTDIKRKKKHFKNNKSNSKQKKKENINSSDHYDPKY